MSEFFVGQKVVCVDDADGQYTPCPAVKGQIYTVRRLQKDRRFIEGIFEAVWLGELKRYCPHTQNADTPFALFRFRPLESRAIQLFRQIAANPNIKIREDA